MTTEYDLKFRVHAYNELQKVKGLLQDRFKPIIEKAKNEKVKIINKDFSLSSKFDKMFNLEEIRKEIEKTIKPFKENHHAKLRVVIKRDEFSLWVWFDICFNGGSYEDKTYYCAYKDNYKYLASFERVDFNSTGFIESVTENVKIELVTYDEVLKILSEIKEYDEKRNKLREQLPTTLREN